jgi:hypothetical protein
VGGERNKKKTPPRHLGSYNKRQIDADDRSARRAFQVSTG